MPKINRLHFFQRFDPAKDFVAIKVFSTNGIDFAPGDKFLPEKVKMPAHKVRAMWNARKIAYADALLNPANVAATIEDDEVKIVKGAFGWFYLEKNGKKLSKGTRDIKEAEAWLEAL